MQPTQTQTPEYMTAAEAAEFLRVPVKRLRNYWRDWDLPAHKIGRELRFDRAELVEFMSRKAT